MSISLPSVIFIPEWRWTNIIFGIILVIVSFGLFNIFYLILLSTNNPADRKNIFSLNKRYTDKMNGSIGEIGLDAIKLQEPTNEELNFLKKKIRKRKLKKLTKI